MVQYSFSHLFPASLTLLCMGWHEGWYHPPCAITHCLMFVHRLSCDVLLAVYYDNALGCLGVDFNALWVEGACPGGLGVDVMDAC